MAILPRRTSLKANVFVIVISFLGRLQLHGTSTISIGFQLYISVKRNIRETNREKKNRRLQKKEPKEPNQP